MKAPVLPALVLLALPALGGAAGIDFNAIALSGYETPVPNPRIEDGMSLRCTNPVNGSPSSMVIRTAPNSNTGDKSVSAKFSRGLFSLTRDGGGSFTMTSIRLFPLSTGGGNGTVTFTGYRNGLIHNTSTFNTGTSLNGIVHSFSGFDDIDELRWEVNNNLAGRAYHQFDDLTVELPPLITVPADLTLSEGAPSVNLVLQREAGASGNLDVGCTWAPVTASPTDLTLGIGSPHTFSFSGSEETKSFLAVASGDTIDESPETVVITWTPDPANYRLSAATTTITIGDTNASNYYNYVNGHGLLGNDADPDADPNGDGVTNIEAYAFRLNPAGPFPAAWRQRLPRFATVGNGSSAYPGITWTLVQPYPADVEFIVGESDDLVEWTEIARRKGYGVGSLWTGLVASSVTESGGLGNVVTVRGREKISVHDQDFLQLELRYSPPGGAE